MIKELKLVPEKKAVLAVGASMQENAKKSSTA
jgi:hypothetical protein